MKTEKRIEISLAKDIWGKDKDLWIKPLKVPDNIKYAKIDLIKNDECEIKKETKE